MDWQIPGHFFPIPCFCSPEMLVNSAVNNLSEFMVYKPSFAHIKILTQFPENLRSWDFYTFYYVYWIIFYAIHKIIIDMWKIIRIIWCMQSKSDWHRHGHKSQPLAAPQRSGKVSNTQVSRVSWGWIPDQARKTNTTVNKTTRYIADDIKVGRTDLSEWVFPSGEGTPLDLHNVAKREFPKCLQRARLRRIRFHEHNLRHTMASLLIQNGAPLAYAKDQLGHSSRKITVDIYGHLVPGVNRQEMNRLPSLNSVQSTDLKMKGK